MELFLLFIVGLLGTAIARRPYHILLSLYYMEVLPVILLALAGNEYLAVVLLGVESCMLVSVAAVLLAMRERGGGVA